ncbi:6-phospho-3-hexuloisomerase [Christensenella tenuis]|uniref:6-phospho-3-hexuloisomerase n=1 Tax=Christensenella tenuis TaxID=2763033 RepID=A0ABR7EFK2_9FIRM|nr:6-phospho-3-hexuloisomerase [Christensenella tenuis]MBC5648532.1 6-phospho-3-hexuloisomerase [Christensenella tenuis]
MDARTEAILSELGGTLGKIDEEQAAAFAQMVYEAPRVFLAGCGRSGLMVRAFAMRCMHMGKTVYVLGDVTTPSIRKGDLLVVASGSGETESLVSHVKKAKKFGAKVATVTIYPKAAIGSMSDCAVWINAPTSKSEEDTGVTSVQPMGSLFEQSLLLFLDTTIVRMMELSGKSSEEMFENHANLE